MEYIVEHFSSEKTRYMIFQKSQMKQNLVADFNYSPELAICAPPLLQKKCKKE